MSPPPSPDLPPRRPLALLIYVTVVLDVMAFGVILPVFPTLLAQVGHLSAAGAAQVFGLYATLFAVVQLFAAPTQGALSDRYGRRPIILASNLGLGADYVLMALAPNLWWLAAGRLISAFAAGSIPAAIAYLVDVTPPEKRAARFGLFTAAAAFGTTIGPAAGGLLSQFDVRAPFWVAAALSLGNGVLVAFLLPESLTRTGRAKLSLGAFNPLTVVIDLLRAHPALAKWGAAAFLLGLANAGVNSVLVLYTSHRYSWSPAAIGIVMAGLGALGVLVQAFLAGRAAETFGPIRVVLGGLVLAALASVGLGLAPTGAWYVAGSIMLCLANVFAPAYQTLLAGAVGPTDQGRLQGAKSSLTSLAAIIAPIGFSNLFAFGVRSDRTELEGGPFFAAAVLFAGMCLVLWPVLRGGASTRPAKATAG